jgi:hypothetical protein
MADEEDVHLNGEAEDEGDEHEVDDGEAEDVAEDESDEEPEKEESEEESEDESEPAPKAKASSRVQRLANRAKEAEARADKLYDTLNRVLAERENKPSTDATRQAEEERLAMMEPHERTAYNLSKEMQMLRFKVHDTEDRSAYQRQAAENPIFKAYEAKVEEAYQQMARSGTLNGATRESILWLIAGHDLVKKNKGPEKKVVSSSSSRAANAKSKPVNARSDGGSQKSKASSLEKRLEGVQL